MARNDAFTRHSGCVDAHRHRVRSIVRGYARWWRPRAELYTRGCPE